MFCCFGFIPAYEDLVFVDRMLLIASFGSTTKSVYRKLILSIISALIRDRSLDQDAKNVNRSFDYKFGFDYRLH